MHDAAFDRRFIDDFGSDSRNLKLQSTKKPAINIADMLELVISLKTSIQIQFGTFIRGRPRTPIHPAPVLLSGILCSTSHDVGTGGKPSTWFPPGDS